MVLEVIDKKSRKDFLLLRCLLYKDNPNFISALHKDIESIFNPVKINFYNHGICKRWILQKIIMLSGALLLLSTWLKKNTTIHRIRFIVMGCKKKFQNKGIESGMIRKLQLEVIPRNTSAEAELAWIGDFNKKILAIHEATGAVREKVPRTYRKNILKNIYFNISFCTASLSSFSFFKSNAVPKTLSQKWVLTPKPFSSFL